MGVGMTSANRAGAKPVTSARPLRMPRMRCPVCNSHCHARTSEELSPETRRLWYQCINVECSMSFTSLLSFERIVSPSAFGDTFRTMEIRDRRPPGHEFGQASLFDQRPARPPGPG